MKQGDSTKMTTDRKLAIISNHVRGILDTLGLDTADESVRDTPERVARIYVQEVFSGMSEDNFPDITLFQSPGGPSIVSQRDIPFSSICEHHLLPFQGTVSVTYRSQGFVLGLSKINRIVDYFSKRP